MSKVVFDGEDVVFEGDQPQNLAAAVNLLRLSAAEGSKMLLSVKVDGAELNWTQIENHTQPYQLLEVKSGSSRELFLQAIDTTLKASPAAEAALNPVLESLLSENWQQSLPKLNAFMQNMAPLLALMAHLNQYAATPGVSAPWKAELTKLLQRVDPLFIKILKLCETQTISELVSVLSTEFQAVYTESLSFVKQKARPSFAAQEILAGK